MASEKYIVFAPWRAGLTNVILSLELLLSIAYITKRRIALPRNFWLDHLTAHHSPKEHWHNLWAIFNRNTLETEFKIVDLENLEDFSKNRSLIESEHSYTTNFSNFVDSVYTFKHPEGSGVDQTCFTNNPLQYRASEDFQKFVSGRVVVDLNRPEKYLHFEGNLFGHFCYQVYPGVGDERNILKQKINKTLSYQERFVEIAKVVKNKLGKYNAVHIRRNDFLKWIPENMEKVASPDKLLSAIKLLYPNDLPLYIATDEKDVNFFKILKQEYQIFFKDNFDFQLSALEITIVEQCICTQADIFYGTWHSTFSKRINVQRGLAGKSVFDYMGINHIVDQQEEIISPYPWYQGPVWGWNSSSYLQWRLE